MQRYISSKSAKIGLTMFNDFFKFWAQAIIFYKFLSGFIWRKTLKKM